MKATNRQVSGSHYKDLKIQPVDFIWENNLNYLQGLAIRYIVRYKNKNGKEDLDKAIHVLELLKEKEYDN